MKQHKKLKSSLTVFSNKKENKEEILSGELGIPIGGQKIVSVANRSGFVYVRLLTNKNELIQAVNTSVPLIYGLAVRVKRVKNTYTIIGKDYARYSNNGGSSTAAGIIPLPNHGGQHSFNPDSGMGADTVWVYSKQFMPMLVFPSGTSMSLNVNPHFYEYQSQWKYPETSGYPSFAPYVPTGTTTAKMVLLWIDARDNSYQLLGGSLFSGGITDPGELAQYIPSAPIGYGIPLAAVKLETGTTSLEWENIYDVRPFLHVTPTGSSGAVPHAPGGRLTLVTGTPVMTSEQAAKTTIYYTPYKGNLYPSYNGSVFSERTITELSLALDANSGHTGYHQSGKNFDLFLYNDGGTDRLGTGPAWSSDTARGTGAGTTELEYTNGIRTNKNSMTLRFGSIAGNTVTVAANRGTYVGYMRTSADGTTTWELGGAAGGGDEVRLFLYNAYNKVLVSAICRDSDNSWTTTNTTYHKFNAGGTGSGANNRVSCLQDTEEDALQISFFSSAYTSVAGNGGIGIGLDSDTQAAQILNNGTFSTTFLIPWQAYYTGYPGIGFHYFQALEACTLGGGTTTFGGDYGTSIIQSGLKIEGFF